MPSDSYSHVQKFPAQDCGHVLPIQEIFALLLYLLIYSTLTQYTQSNPKAKS